MSAAVIGRQLRHQAVTRTSGPLVPPLYKGRPRTPSLYGRPYSPVATSSTQGTGPGGAGDPGGGGLSDSNAHSASLKAPSLQSKSKTSSVPLSDAPRLRCTMHCFCIALKALSFGLFLLTAGAILFAAGFLLENNYIQSQGRRPDQFDADQRTTLMMYRNLTYAGPVVMGLGAVVVIAGLVLTFEERDTLGVKVIPTKASPGPAAKPIPVVIAGLSESIPGSRKNTIPSISSTLASAPSRPSASTVIRQPGADANWTMTQMMASNAKDRVTDRSRTHETIEETTLSESGSTAVGTSGTESSAGTAHQYQRRSQVSAKRPVVRDECCIFTTSSSSGTSSYHRRLASIEEACYGCQSPQDIVISDPEACSLPVRRQSARCSCSASPTLSSCDLFFGADDARRDSNDFTVQAFDHHRLQMKLLQQQQQLILQQQQQLEVQQRLLFFQRQEATCRSQESAVAFVESDGLSSDSSSRESLFARPSGQSAYQKASIGRHRTCFTTAKVHQEGDESDVQTPLLHSEHDVTRPASRPSHGHKHEIHQKHDSQFPQLRPPEAF